MGVTASSSLALFAAFADLAALADFGFAAAFLFDESAVGVLGVESFNLVVVLGVFAGLISLDIRIQQRY